MKPLYIHVCVYVCMYIENVKPEHLVRGIKIPMVYDCLICQFCCLGIKGVFGTTTYEARVLFQVQVRVRDSKIFEKIGCRCSGVR